MANRLIQDRSGIDAVSSETAARTDQANDVEPPRPANGSLRQGQVRLASVDLIAAAAVIGSIDSLVGRDIVVPEVDLSLSRVNGSGTGLAEADLDRLLSVPIEVRPERATAPETGLFDMDLEQLLALEVFDADAPPDDLTLMALEDLARITVSKVDSAPLEPIFDLTKLALEVLQDIQFGDRPDGFATPYRQLASLDLSSHLDLPGINRIALADRSTEPKRSAGSDYAADPPQSRHAGSGRELPEPAAGIQPPIARGEPDGGFETVAVTAPVAPLNRAPVAKDDAVAGLEDAVITGSVLDNDHDPDGDPLTVSGAGLLTTAEGGMAMLLDDGTFEYKPQAGFVGTDCFTYSIEDGRGGTASATVTVTIAPAGGDVLGTPYDDWLIGTPGDDLIDGKGGNDMLVGLTGADRLTGGDGIDTVSYAESVARVEISLETGIAQGGDARGDVLLGIENLTGSTFDDVIFGNSEGNVLEGGAGNDTLEGAQGNDVLRGGGGSDEVLGGLGDDLLFGDAGEDFLNGGLGDDVLDGGPGSDFLFGGNGRDSFALGPGSGGDTDTIEDFVDGEDALDISAFGLTSFLGISVVGDGLGGTVVTLPTGDSVALLNLDPALLMPADMII